MSAMSENRRLLIAGNWKMYKTGAETVEFIERLKELLSSDSAVDVTLAPSFTSLEAAIQAAQGSSISIAAQNVFWEQEGAFTGEVSATMLKSMGVKQVIIGHSERRQYFGETDETVNRRIKAALSGGLVPIVCVGETLEQREAGQTFKILKTQLETGLEGIDSEAARTLILAYEPVWAIGTGKTATPEIAQEAHKFIRETLQDQFDKGLVSSLRILYGGSVKPENTAELLTQPDIDGGLVGGASLKPDVFYGIINYKGV
ncbi:MAG: triose-phosphate isomerase [Candidatus Adiutricales bacterium]